LPAIAGAPQFRNDPTSWIAVRQADNSRKDTDKHAGAKRSPLVVFVKAIQDQFPAEVPIRFSTENSLATQISGVLARARERGIDFRREPAEQIPPED
jgi:hypothetical protein